MNRRNKSAVAQPAAVRKPTWCWRRSIGRGQEELWTARLHALGDLSWVVTERPDRSRLLLEVYTPRRSIAVFLARTFGGKMRLVKAAEWMRSRPAPPLLIGRGLRIVHDEVKRRTERDCPQLHIPQGMAFGGGEHATTRMLLQALVRHRDWSGTTLLDLGTGSGVLALVARLFSAKKITGADFDPIAVRTARQNEALNFSTPLIRWQCADVKRLRATARYDLVLANLFSGILVEAAPRIAACLSPTGRLWMSGILREQQQEVIVAYRRQGLKLARAVSRGKWVMLQWR